MLRNFLWNCYHFQYSVWDLCKKWSHSVFYTQILIVIGGPYDIIYISSVFGSGSALQMAMNLSPDRSAEESFITAG